MNLALAILANYNNQFMAGVWCDAADGILAGNPHETGQTDSIIGFNLRLSTRMIRAMSTTLLSG